MTFALGLEHPTMHDHSTEAGGVRVWVCSFCGEVGEWDEHWSYWGTIECHKKKGCGTPRGCGHAKIHKVSCGCTPHPGDGVRSGD